MLSELIGKRVVVVADMGLNSPSGVAEYLFAARHISAVGVVQFELRRIISGLLLVEHDDGSKALYRSDELEFFSEQVLAFAQLKASRVQVLEAKLKAMKEATELP